MEQIGRRVVVPILQESKLGHFSSSLERLLVPSTGMLSIQILLSPILLTLGIFVISAVASRIFAGLVFRIVEPGL